MISYLVGVLGEVASKNKKEEVVEEQIVEKRSIRQSDSYYVKNAQTKYQSTYDLPPQQTSQWSKPVRATELGSVRIQTSNPVGLDEYRKSTQEYTRVQSNQPSFQKSASPTYDYTTTTNYESYNTKQYVAPTEMNLSRSTGWVCFNDKRIENLIRSFNDLEVMPRALPNALRNLDMDNYEKIVLVYLYIDGADDDLINLVAELKKFCSGALYLILLKEAGTYGPKNVNYSAPRKYSEFKVRKEAYSDEYSVDKDERRKMADFIRVETVYPGVQLGGVYDYKPATSVLGSYRPEITDVYKTTDYKLDNLLKTSPTTLSQYESNTKMYDVQGGTIVKTQPYTGRIDGVSTTENVDFQTYSGTSYDL
jgi:hypothetical protein